jgi:choline-sulfatase
VKPRRSGVSRLLAGILLATVPSVASSKSANGASPEAHPNVILITMDTLRADHLGCYGDAQVHTPTIDGLAHDGLLYQHAVSQVPLTWPSHAAILTGTYPFQNGVQDFTAQPLSPQFRLLAQAFHASGYATGAVVSSFVLDRSWGLARGFDYYDDAFSPTSFQQKDLGLVDRRADESVSRALAWLRNTTHRPFFLWLHLYDPHSPYDPPEPFHTEYTGHLYDGEIAYADHELGRLVAWLKSSHTYDRTLIVFVSDHGESLGEHGEREHGFFLYQATTHVPLIVKPPANRRIAPGKIDEPVETVAIGPTLLALAGLHDAIEKQFQAKALPEGKTTVAQPAVSAAYSETFYPFSSFGWSPLRALVTGRYQFIDAPQAELYDLQADPGEKINLAPQQPATIAVFREKLKARVQDNPFAPHDTSTHGLSTDATEKLQALGYLAYRAPTSSQPAENLPDPKTKLWEYNSILEAGDAFRVNDFARGEALLAKVQEHDPELYIVPYMLGEAALRQGKSDEAAAQLQRTLKLAADFDQAMTALARALYQKGDMAGAREWLMKALDRNPQNFRAWYELGWMESKAGDKDAAETAYRKSIAIQPNFAPSQRGLGMIRYEHKDYQGALPFLQRARDLGTNEAPLDNLIGICLSLTGRLPQAVTAYQQALRLDPGLADAHLNLGYAYEQLGQKDLARREYGEACRLKGDLCPAVRSRLQ